MAMNKVKAGSQMYQFLNDNGNRGYTFNVIKGKCPHDCSYCYMKRYSQPELHFDESELKTDLGFGNFIFVGSSCDMWAEYIPEEWIERVCHKCLENSNRYLFQTKNPTRFMECVNLFPDNVLLGTTIETNRHYNFISLAPKTEQRKEAMSEMNYPKMVSIEPIMDFDLVMLVDWIKAIEPEFVSIGADSKGHHLPEPDGDKVKALIEALREFTGVKIKNNLKRLLGGNP